MQDIWFFSEENIELNEQDHQLSLKNTRARKKKKV